MKQFLALAALGGTMFGGTPAVADTPADTAGWKLVFSDEFDGTSLNADKWHAYQDCWGGGNQERECYTRRPDNVSVHDGQLDLAAHYETVTGPSLSEDLRKPGEAPPPATKPFSSGKVSTKGKFTLTYGRIEVRAKSPVGQGVWPAIWLLPVQDLYGPWPGSGEIDVMEAVNLGVKCGSCVGGVENQIYGTIHFGSNMHHYQGSSIQKAYPLPKGTEGDWHTYRVDWNPDEMVWAVDGKEYERVRLHNWRDPLQKEKPAPAVRNAPFDRPFYLILNLAIGGQWPESHDAAGVLLDNYPKHFAIDWVHIYQCDNPQGCN